MSLENLFRSPAKKLICAKRTSYKLAVWLDSDNDCAINNRVYDLLRFPRFSLLLSTEAALSAHRNGIKSSTLDIGREKSHKSRRQKFAFYLFTQFPLCLQHHSCTANCIRKL